MHYDGTVYNARKVLEKIRAPLGIHHSTTWAGFGAFHLDGRSPGMGLELTDRSGIITTQSTTLAGSQASQIRPDST
jgi:arginine/lysine/ornithine decarboxylase